MLLKALPPKQERTSLKGLDPLVVVFFEGFQIFKTFESLLERDVFKGIQPLAGLGCLFWGAALECSRYFFVLRHLRQMLFLGDPVLCQRPLDGFFGGLF